ncbi:MAG: alpha/beta hydrolase [Erysipelotrichaceae bacterium]
MTKIKKIVITIFVLLLVSTMAFFLWASQYYKADKEALAVLNNDNIIVEENYIHIGSNSKQGIIFYPGAKVEYTAYLPILRQLNNECDINIYLVKMPLNMAIFDSNAADRIIKNNKNIDDWYMAGHSMGGAMASSFASENEKTIKGLFLLGAYVYGDFPIERSLTIYGSFNDNLEDNINYTTNIIKIEGGNHAQFGNYGKQKGDKEATISDKQQQDIAVQAIKAFLKENR